MVDLHTHILPYIDDGASNTEEAYKLMEHLKKQNVTCAVCTPHFNPIYTSLEEFIQHRDSALKHLEEFEFSLIMGSETVLHEFLLHYPDLKQLCIGNTNYLLVELSFDKKWDDKLFFVLERIILYYDMIPIIAHVERYPSINKKLNILKKLHDLGCIIQVNTGSLLNKNLKHKVFYFMKHGFVDVLGSDCHNIMKRPPIITEAIELIATKFGKEYMYKLINNSFDLTQGKDIRENTRFIVSNHEDVMSHEKE
jgi:protein-tyrosine phosphatase